MQVSSARRQIVPGPIFPPRCNILGQVPLVATAVVALGLACGAIFRNPRPYELAMAVQAYIGVQGKGPRAVAAMAPAMT